MIEMVEPVISIVPVKLALGSISIPAELLPAMLIDPAVWVIEPSKAPVPCSTRMPKRYWPPTKGSAVEIELSVLLSVPVLMIEPPPILPPTATMSETLLTLLIVIEPALLTLLLLLIVTASPLVGDTDPPVVIVTSPDVAVKTGDVCEVEMVSWARTAGIVAKRANATRTDRRALRGRPAKLRDLVWINLSPVEWTQPRDTGSRGAERAA